MAASDKGSWYHVYHNGGSVLGADGPFHTRTQAEDAELAYTLDFARTKTCLAQLRQESEGVRPVPTPLQASAIVDVSTEESCALGVFQGGLRMYERLLLCGFNRINPKIPHKYIGIFK